MMALFGFLGPFGLAGRCNVYGMGGPNPIVGAVTFANMMTYVWVGFIDHES